jgi:hypothetical protein
MKKFFIIALAGLVCLAFTAPAMAKMEFSGTIEAQMWYEDLDGNAAAGGYNKTVGGVQGDNGVDQTWIDLRNTGNTLKWLYTSEDKNIMGKVQLRPINAGEGNYEEAWVQWQVSPMVQLRVGKGAQTYAINAPLQWVGADTNAPVVGIGMGNIHGGSAREQIKLYIRPADNVRIEFAMIDPDNDNAEVLRFAPATNAGINGETVREENVIPRFDLAVNFKIANFTFEPSLTWLQQEYDQVAAGSDDDITIWGYALGMKAAFGPVGITAEIAGGENLANGNTVTATALTFNTAAAVGYIPVGSTNLKIADSDIFAGFIDFSFKFGPATLHAIYGYQQVDNDGDPAVANDAGEFDQAYQMIVFNLPISVAKGFTITPEIAFYDYDDNAEVAGAQIDYGDLFVIGVRFKLAF